MEFKLSRKTLFHFGLLTLFGFSFIGALIIVFIHDKPLFSIFNTLNTIDTQIAIGTLYGFAASGLALILINLAFFKSSKLFFVNLINSIQIKWYDILFISFCAGVGEEILFRGALQGSLGIWITSLLFVALHGYLNPKNWQLSMYGFYLVFVSAGFGYIFEIYGIFSAITTHFWIDVILFTFLKTQK